MPVVSSTALGVSAMATDLTHNPIFRADLMHAPLTQLNVDEMRERHRVAWNQWMAETETIRQDAYRYWAKIREAEHATLGRVQNVLWDYRLRGKKAIPVEVIEAAIGGEEPAVEPPAPAAGATRRFGRPIMDTQLPLEVA